MSKDMTNEVFSLTHKSTPEDFEHCVLWMKKNLESKNKVTIIIRKIDSANHPEN